MDVYWKLMKTRLEHGLVMGDVAMTRVAAVLSITTQMDGYSVRLGEKISHRHRCVFVHVPKTGGSSIKQILFDSAMGGSHASAEELRVLFPNEFEHYFKFAVVRNPWDRLVSAYSYDQSGGNGSEFDRAVQSQLISFGGFEEFCDELQAHWLPGGRFMKILPHFLPQSFFVADSSKKILVDKVLRFERLQEDFESIPSGIFQNKTLPWLRATPHPPYQSYYNERTKRLVADLFRDDIDMFDYSF